MAKPIPKITVTGPLLHEKIKPTTIHSYRAERLSTYEYQGYKLTRKEDGTYIEEPFGKPTLLDLIMRKVFEAMKAETNEVFQANKKILK